MLLLRQWLPHCWPHSQSQLCIILPPTLLRYLFTDGGGGDVTTWSDILVGTPLTTFPLQLLLEWLLLLIVGCYLVPTPRRDFCSWAVPCWTPFGRTGYLLLMPHLPDGGLCPHYCLIVGGPHPYPNLILPASDCLVGGTGMTPSDPSQWTAQPQLWLLLIYWTLFLLPVFQHCYWWWTEDTQTFSTPGPGV